MAIPEVLVRDRSVYPPGLTTQESASRETKEATPAQLATAELLFYCHLRGELNKTAKNYAVVKAAGGTNKEEDVKNNEAQAVVAFEDLYFKRENPAAFEEFKQHWGIEAEAISRHLDAVSPGLQEKRKEIFEQAPSFGKRRQSETLIRAAWEFSRSRPDQKLRFLQMAGNSTEEAKDVLLRLGASFMGNAGTLTLQGATGINTLIAGAVPFLGNINDETTRLALSGSSIALILGLYFVLMQNFRLLQDKKIRTSPDILGFGLYHLSKRILPNNPKLRGAIRMLIPGIPLLAVEAGIYSSVLSGNESAASVAFVRGMTFGACFLIQGTVAEAVLRLKGEKARKA